MRESQQTPECTRAIDAAAHEEDILNLTYLTGLDIFAGTLWKGFFLKEKKRVENKK